MFAIPKCLTQINKYAMLYQAKATKFYYGYYCTITGGKETTGET